MRLLFLALIVSVVSCKPTENPKEQQPLDTTESPNIVKWAPVDTIDVDAINADLINGKLTVDVGIYFPSNLDTAFKKVTLARMVESFIFAKQIYRPTDIQLNLLWVKSGEVDPKYFAIQSNEIPGIPDTEYVNLYEASRRNPSVLTDHALNAFKSIVEPDPNNTRTIYLIVLQDVFYPFLTVSEGRNWMIKSVRTGGLSFPSYSYVDQIPEALRGVITITNLDREDRYRRTIAHELGHKLMNVSHEYRKTHPGFEVFANGGLMLYGKGEEIPSGKEGRWHYERLLLSPYLYTSDEQGLKTYNEDYKEGGHYYDPLYGDYVIHFSPEPVIDENW
ncbi:MAG: hypothetical protein AAGC88_10480 [Bacteroidota bacterium]